MMAKALSLLPFRMIGKRYNYDIFPGRDFFYVKDAKDVNEWRKTIWQGIKEKFALEAHYFRPA
jgi:hypothetical protein